MPTRAGAVDKLQISHLKLNINRSTKVEAISSRELWFEAVKRGPIIYIYFLYDRMSVWR